MNGRFIIRFRVGTSGTGVATQSYKPIGPKRIPCRSAFVEPISQASA